MRHLFKKHQHIGIDIDETIAGTVEGLIRFAHKNGMLRHIESIEDIRKHDTSGLSSDMTQEEANRLWENYGKSTIDPSTVPLIPGASEGVHTLYRHGKNISVITARSNHESWKLERTLKWMGVHFPFIQEDDIHFVNHFSTDAIPKSTVCKQIGVSLMIDDALENVGELCQSGIECILLEKPWNRDIIFDHPLLYRVKNWEEIIATLNSGT